ncbi:hypothetical protein GCM10025868_17850 [Angustibacter aerolatus]|uniref:Uncharacterized protein n=1 Tax=Angustibacter aerolatus TaxID=1162965 RepID=A0ABQ6JEE3_9ACTN|nr:hypothetical protein GCM10025868_17850 [Angustibacter aerolatus]
MSSIIASSRPAPESPVTSRGVLSSLLDAECLRQPPGRVDGEHDDPASALGGTHPERRGGGGLADAAAAAADDDAGRGVVEQRVDVEAAGSDPLAAAAGRRGHAIPWVRSIAARPYSAPRSTPPGSAGTS